MNLLDLAVKITCDDQASGEVDKIGDGIKNKLGAAAKAGVAAVAALGTATITIGKTALDAYSNYEQLVGGIDTLFKASSGKMQQYAANAYQTAGVSANRYMEISTSFAAALISSLGGNTEAAADMANTAITDMSDNANKMGTSLETVQEAYMSLSRGNYEMLDSLKLGYGGTKSELERLLSDAENFSAAQGQVRDFSVDSYSDIVEAIHIVQDEMGITGTTAEEAATTIEGSVNMAKAAWDNWLAGLGNEDADMEGLTDQLVGSVATAGENIIPRVGQIMETLGQTVADYAPNVGRYLRATLIGVLPEAVQGPLYDAFAGADKVFGKFADVFNDNLKPAADAADSVFSAIGSGVTTFSDNVNDLVLPAIETLSPAFEDFFGAIEYAQPLLTFIADIIGTVLAAAISTAIKVFSAIVEVIAFVITGFQQLYEDISGFVAGVVQFFTTDLPNAINALVQWFASLPGNIATFLSTVITKVVAWVANMASNAVSAGSQFISGLAGFMSGLAGNVASWLSGAISTVVGWVRQFASNATSAASQFGSRLRSGLAAIPGTLGNIGSNIIQGIVNGITGAAGKVKDAIAGAIGDAIDFAKHILGIKSPSRVFRKIGQYTMQGAALGVDDGADLLLRSTDNAMRGMISTAQDTKYTSNVDRAETTASVIEWLDTNLGDIIASYTPYIGMRDFDRLARKAMANA
nr:MAG TPA: tail tape measure protein [Caudoviricetes sp.]